MEQKNTVLTEDPILGDYNPVIRSSFSDLFFQGSSMSSFNSFWSQAENEVIISQDFKRVLKKAQQADISILKSKLTDLKRTKNSDGSDFPKKKQGSDFLSIIKRISKLP